jgi:hypothetical protein
MVPQMDANDLMILNESNIVMLQLFEVDLLLKTTAKPDDLIR